ncbi:PAS domain S-box protein [Mastigocladopsis repens]|uniref:PAS domain S-box protein n=1 Tax=Mastigocladopsis repens TaxID=221287 RepID=UPI0002F2225A|nr:PAS domain S-box protein [Mastigocladopsis repens]
MHAFAQFISLPSVDSAIDFSPLKVAPDTPLSEVVSLMRKSQPQASCVLIVENLHIVGWFTEHDALGLLYSDLDIQKAKISEVMETSVLTLKLSEVSSIKLLLSFLRQHRLFFIPIVDEQGQLVGLVSYESICQVLEQGGEIISSPFRPLSEEASPPGTSLLVNGEGLGVRFQENSNLSNNPIISENEAQQRLLEAAVVNANDAIVIFEANDASDDPLGGRIVYVNEAFTCMSGWSADEVIGKTLPILYGEKTSESEIDRIRVTLGDGTSMRTEFINYHKNGSTYWVEVSISPIASSEGKTTHFVAIHRDISDCKLAEEALRWSEELFRQTAENIRQVLFVRDTKQDQIIYVNPAYEEIWGRSRARLYEKSFDFLEAIHPLDRDRVIAAILTQELGHLYSEEYRIIRPDGEERWIWTRAVPLKNELGEVFRIFGISEDITERKRATEALRESEQRFRTLADEVPVLIWMSNTDGLNTFCNKSCVEFTGRPLEELLGIGWVEGIHPEDRQPYFDMYLSAFKNHQRFQYVCRYLHADGEYRWLINIGVPRFASDGNLIGYIGCSTDITERVQAEAALQQAQAELKQANAELETRVEERTRVVKEMNRQIIFEMTDRLYIEEQLRQSQEMLQLIMDNIPQSIFWKDTACVYLGSNRNFAKTVGLESSEDVVGKTEYDLVTNKEEADLYTESDLRVMQTDTPEYRLIFAHQRNDGKQVWLEASKIPLHDAEGNVMGVLGTFEDITDRKQAQEALEKSEERFRFLVESIPQQVWFARADGHLEYVNQRALEYHGCTHEEVEGWKWEQWIHPEDLPRCLDLWMRSLATGETFEVEFRLFGIVDQGYRWHLARALPLRDKQGQILSWFGTNTDIHDRKQAEEALQRSQERFRNLVEMSSDLVWEIDEHAVHTYVSPKVCEILGYQPQEVLGKTLFELMLPEEAKRFANRLGSIAAVQQPFKCLEFAVIHKDGHLVILEGSGVPIFDAEGKFRGYRGIDRDITERKQAEESLRLRDRAITASSNGIMIADVTMPNSPIIYANPALEQITGYSVAEVIGKNCCFLHGADINQPAITVLHDAIAQGKSCTVVVRNYRKNGALFWNEISISPVYDINGKYTHSIGIQNDISERKQAEVALLISQEQLQYLLSSSPGVIYSCKIYSDYGITFMSENVIAMLGYEAQEFMENPSFWASHVHPEDLQQVFAAASKLLEQGQYSHEYRFLHKNGTYQWMYDQAKLVQDDAGNPLEIVGYWLDITERKQLEEELKAALHKEKELNELKSRFVSMTSHEFRTPLSTILSSSELLEHYRHKWTEEKQLSHLHRIQTAVQHMTEMLNNVLVIGKAEAGKLSFIPKPFDLVEYCHYLVEELQLNVNNQHAINFNSQYKSMPCCMDEKLLGHILSNLLSNAIKYSSSGSTVRFTLTFKDGLAVFTIQDHGIGIPSEDLPHLFESFHRATNVGNIQGTGLGLAIVKKCVDVHDGEITVKSEVGVGTIFTVTLPLNNHIKP